MSALVFDYRQPKESVEDPVGYWAACPLCDGQMTTEIVDFSFTHGALYIGTLHIHVTLPVRHCKDCDIESLDHVGAEIKDNAVNKAFGEAYG